MLLWLLTGPAVSSKLAPHKTPESIVHGARSEYACRASVIYTLPMPSQVQDPHSPAAAVSGRAESAWPRARGGGNPRSRTRSCTGRTRPPGPRWQGAGTPRSTLPRASCASSRAALPSAGPRRSHRHRSHRSRSHRSRSPPGSARQTPPAGHGSQSGPMADRPSRRPREAPVRRALASAAGGSRRARSS